MQELLDAAAALEKDRMLVSWTIEPNGPPAYIVSPETIDNAARLLRAQAAQASDEPAHIDWERASRWMNDQTGLGFVALFVIFGGGVAGGVIFGPLPWPMIFVTAACAWMAVVAFVDYMADL